MENMLPSLIGSAGANGLLFGAIYLYFRYGRNGHQPGVQMLHLERRFDALERAGADTQRLLIRQTEILDTIRENLVRLVTLAEFAQRTSTPTMHMSVPAGHTAAVRAHKETHEHER